MKLLGVWDSEMYHIVVATTYKVVGMALGLFGFVVMQTPDVVTEAGSWLVGLGAFGAALAMILHGRKEERKIIEDLKDERDYWKAEALRRDSGQTGL